MSTFTWKGRELPLFDHDYNATITNERAVEIPIAWDFLQRHGTGVGLELGDVLHNYMPAAVEVHPWTIVDRWSPDAHVDTHMRDVFDIQGQYDWIVSISTIEHVRYGEPGIDDNRCGAVAALAYLRGLLKPDGHMLVTVGLGQNPWLDDFLLGNGYVDDDDWMPFGARPTLLRRFRHSTDITQNAWAQHRGAPPGLAGWEYGPTHGANAVWIGEWGPE